MHFNICSFKIMPLSLYIHLKVCRYIFFLILLKFLPFYNLSGHIYQNHLQKGE